MFTVLSTVLGWLLGFLVVLTSVLKCSLPKELVAANKLGPAFHIEPPAVFTFSNETGNTGRCRGTVLILQGSFWGLVAQVAPWTVQRTESPRPGSPGRPSKAVTP